MRRFSFLFFIINGCLCIIKTIALFAVPRVSALGNQTDPVAQIRPDRDGGSVGVINGKIVWFYSDTDYTKDGKLYGFYDNTGAIGVPDNPLVVVGPAQQAIPFTPEEQTFNTNHSWAPRLFFFVLISRNEFYHHSRIF